MLYRNKLSFKHKNNKLLYFLKSYTKAFLPQFILNKETLFKDISDEELKRIDERVNYYNKLTSYTKLELSSSMTYQDLEITKGTRVYPLDLIYYLKFFPKNFRFVPLFGDVTHVPELPSITKSRPIHGDNRHSVLFKLNKVRHFFFIKNDKKFQDKKEMLVWRGALYQHLENRKSLLENYIAHPKMDIGFNKGNVDKPEWKKKSLTISEQLEYKFIMSLEGNDVATNLKWIMSSNSLCFSPALKYETWFMEGQLIPNYHYVQVADDFSDLEDKMNYYLHHPNEAEKIIANAHEFVSQFRDKRIEKIIKLKVLEKYFNQTMG